MTRPCLLAVFLAAVSLVLVSADHPSGDHLLVTPDDLRWVDGPPSLPPGCQAAVLEGDPAKEGPFVIRLKLPAGYRVMPHTHPSDERVTIISGTMYFGMGGKFDEGATKAMPAGSYGRTAAGKKHFAFTREGAIIQVHGAGPWAINYVNPADDPRTKK